MLANFNKAFKKDTGYRQIPNEIIQQLNRRLPEGLEYVQIESTSDVVLAPFAEKMQFQINVEVPREVEDNPSRVAEYLYRTQTTLKIHPNENGEILINNIPVPVKDVIVFPLGTKEILKNSVELCVTPKPFPPPFKLKVEFDGEIKEFLIQRVPHQSMDRLKFEAINENVIRFSYIIDECNRGINISLHLNIEKAKTVSEIIQATKVYQAFLEGKVKIGDTLFDTKTLNIPNQKFIATLNFWEQVYEVMKLIGKEILPAFPIKFQDAQWVKKLYRCLIEDKMYKEIIEAYSITIQCTEALSGEVSKDFVGKTIGFHFTQKIEVDLFNTKFNLLILQIIPEVSIEKVLLVDKDTYKYEIVVQKSKEKIDAIYKLFVDEAKMMNYLDKLDLNKIDFKKIEEIELEMKGV